MFRRASYSTVSSTSASSRKPRVRPLTVASRDASSLKHSFRAGAAVLLMVFSFSLSGCWFVFIPASVFKSEAAK